MSHEILGLREVSPGKISHVFHGQKWSVPTVALLLNDPQKYVDLIPESDRWNIFFTVHHVLENAPAPRSWANQDVMLFDIDGIDPDKAELTAKFVCEVIGLEYQKTGVLFSGHGIQMFVQLEKPIIDNKFFTEKREIYKLVIQRINQGLEDGSFKGKADPAVFSSARLMRMPNTWNRKPEKGPDVMAYVIQKHMEHQGFSLERACGAPELGPGESIHSNAYSKMPPPDTESVLSECRFLIEAKERPADMSEEQWYAMLSITGRLKEGRRISHEMSKGHPKYSVRETDLKIDQALVASGPRTCTNINKIWGKCSTCPHFGSIESPITIQGPDYIATESTGFYYVIETKSGTKEVPAYEDLIKHFVKKHGGFVTNEGKIPYVYDKDTNTWAVMSEIELQAFAYKEMKPKPRSVITNEFYTTIIKTKVARSDKMGAASKRKLNLQNGVLNLETMQMEKPRLEHYFMSNLPYEFNPEAKAPKFEKFLADITLGNVSLQNILLEYMGYCISGDDYWEHKALILYGDGRNGKSTFNKVLKALVGPGSYSSLNIDALGSDQKRAMLEGKLFNLADENASSGFMDASVFKALSAGEEVDIKHVYHRPYSIKNRAKLIFNCNTMPTSRDSTLGMMSRLLCIPFNAYFNADDPNTDKHIDAKLAGELPGILNLCIEGYQRLKKQGCFSESAASRELLEDYSSEVQGVDSWFQDYIIKAREEDYFTIDSAFNSYLQKCDRQGIKYPESRQNFSFQLRRLSERMGCKKKQKRVGIERPLCIFGARLVTGHTEENKTQDPY